MTILRMSFLSGILIAAIVVLRTVMLQRLPKWVFPILWTASLFRLLIPLSIPSRFSVHTVAAGIKVFFPQKEMAAQNVSTAAPWVFYEYATGSGTSGSVSVAASTGMGSLGMEAVSWLWLLGLTACALFFLTKHFQCLKEYRAALPVKEGWIEGWKREHRVWRGIDIRQSDQISAALTYGVFRPVVLLPKATDWVDEKKLNFVLVHEFMHIRRFDILLKWLLTAAVCVHWFNPFVWIMYFYANRDIELACDEAVIRVLGEAAKPSYALTLIELQEKQNFFTPLTNNFGKNAIEERTVSIMKTKKMTIAGIVAAAAVVISILIVFATDAVSSPADHAEVAGQKVFEEQETQLVSGDVSLFMDDPVSLWNGVAAAHDVKNGHMVVYRKEDGDWMLRQGEKITMDISISDSKNKSLSVISTYDSYDDLKKVGDEVFYEDHNFSEYLSLQRADRVGESNKFTAVYASDSNRNSRLEGQTAVIGYIADGAARDIFVGRIEGSQSIVFYAPEDGEYEFYLIGASSDAIQVRSLSIK